MSRSNSIIRINRKGRKKFAFGDDGEPFEVDIVEAFQRWINIDDEFRPAEIDEEGNRLIPKERMPEYHEAAIGFVRELSGDEVSKAEALDFLARLREQYDELALFFRPKSLEERGLLDTSEEAHLELRFSEEDSATSRN